MTTNEAQSAAPVQRLVGRIRDLLTRATPGRWHNSHMEIDDSGCVIMAGGRDRIKVNWNGGTWRKQCEADAELIALAINSLPALLSVVEAAAVVSSQRNGPYLMADMDATMKAESDLLAALSLLPNAETNRPPSGGPVQ